VVVRRQVPSEQAHGGEVDRALREHLEDHGKPSGGPGGLNAVVGLVLGEVERVPAVDKERPVARAQVQVAGVELGDVGHQLRRSLALARGETLQPSHELGVGEPTHGSEDVVRHGPLYHRRRTVQVRSGGSQATKPPSTRSVAPVVKLDSPEARKR